MTLVWDAATGIVSITDTIESMIIVDIAFGIIRIKVWKHIIDKRFVLKLWNNQL
jgi:hypothetical protein